MQEMGIEAMTVNEVTRVYPATLKVFNDFGIDSCCGGAVPVREAAVRDGVDPEAVVAAIRDAIRGAEAVA